MRSEAFSLGGRVTDGLSMTHGHRCLRVKHCDDVITFRTFESWIDGLGFHIHSFE